MPQIINTNIASLNAQRNLNSSQSANSTALERLSSGLRINSAKDDAAGLAISTKFESQTRGLNQAIRNAGDGISLAQTAEGALGSMTDNLQRVRELAVQSANATNSDEDRVALQQEVSALVAEITRTADETNFNGRNLFDGNFNGTFQIGANAGQTVDVQIGELTANRLGTSASAGVSAIGTDQSIGNGDLVINGVTIQASRAEDDNASTSAAATSAISKAAAINRLSEQTGVTAQVNDNEVAGTDMVGASTTGTMKINGIEIEVTTSADTQQTRASIEEAINAVADQTGVRAISGETDAQGVKLVAEDGRNIQIELNTETGDTLTAASTGLAEAGTYQGGYTLVANGDVSEIVIEGGNGTGRGDIANAGLTAGTYSRAVAATVSETETTSIAEANLGLSTGSSQTIAGVDDGGAGTAGLEANYSAESFTFALTNSNTSETVNFTLALDATADWSGGADTATTIAADLNTLIGADANLNGILTASGTGTDLTFAITGGDYLGSDWSIDVGGTGALGTAIDGLTATQASGSDGTQFAADVSDYTAQNTNYSIKIGDEAAIEGTYAAGGDMADLASTLSAESADLNVWEQVSFTIDGSAGNFDITTAGTFDIAIGGGTTDLANIGLTIGMTTAELADSINNYEFTGTNGENFAMSAQLDADGNINVTLDNFTGETIDTSVTTAAGTLQTTAATGSQDLTAATEVQGSLAFSSNSGDDVSISLSDPNSAGELFNGASATSSYTGVNGLGDGDLVINGVQIAAAKPINDTASSTKTSDGDRILSSDKSLSGIAVAAAINEVESETGVSAEINATQVVGGDGSSVTSASLAEFEVGDQADLYINGVSVGTVTLQADGTGAIDTDRARADALNLVNQTSGQTGVVAEDNGVSLTMSAQDGRNISIAIDDKSGANASIGALFGMDASVDGIGESSFGSGATAQSVNSEAKTYETTYSTVTLTSAKAFTVEGGANGNDEVEALGLKLGTYGGGEDGQFLKDVDISTFEGAQAAITAIDNALETVASQRAELGALQNRFESTVSNLAITAENLTAANSRIRDADFAAETAELSRTQVLQQAGISILAQANQRPQQVLSLLG